MFKKVWNFILWIIRALRGGVASATQDANEDEIASAGDDQERMITRVVVTEEGGKTYMTTHYKDGEKEVEVIGENGDAEVNNASDFNDGN